MIEIDDPIRRKRMLARLGGIEETAFLRVGGETISGVAEADQDRTTAEGKASSVQFVHFPVHGRNRSPRSLSRGRRGGAGLRHPRLRPHDRHSGSNARGTDKRFRMR